MRYCFYCKKPMFTSNHTIWIGKANFDVHKECEDKFKEENLKELEIK